MAQADLLLKALADTTRQRLLSVLSSHELTVSDLVEVLGQPQSTISRHLKVLRDSGLLVDRRAGATVRYATVPLNLSSPPADFTRGSRKPRNGCGHQVVAAGSASLRDRLLEWVAQQPLTDSVYERLRRVLDRQRPRPGDFFETVGARWDQLRTEAFGSAFHLEALTALLPADWVVADIGTGTGYLLGILAGRFPKVIAVDPAETMLEVARHRSELREIDNVEFRQGSLDRLPIATGEVDLAIASLVLHHVPEPAAAMADLQRCLRPGGLLLIIEQEQHNEAAFHERMGDHWWGFAPQVLTDWAKEVGLTSARVVPLRTAQPANPSGDSVPPLFALVARKARTNENTPAGKLPVGKV